MLQVPRIWAYQPRLPFLDKRLSIFCNLRAPPVSRDVKRRPSWAISFPIHFLSWFLLMMSNVRFSFTTAYFHFEYVDFFCFCSSDCNFIIPNTRSKTYPFALANNALYIVKLWFDGIVSIIHAPSSIDFTSFYEAVVLCNMIAKFANAIGCDIVMVSFLHEIILSKM